MTTGIYRVRVIGTIDVSAQDFKEAEKKAIKRLFKSREKLRVNVELLAETTEPITLREVE